MIYGVGIDIVLVSRIKSMVEKFGDKFLTRIFTDNEISGPLYSLYNNHINENGDITINKQFGIEDYDENGKFFGVYDKGSGTSYTVYDSKSGPKFHKHSH